MPKAISSSPLLDLARQKFTSLPGPFKILLDSIEQGQCSSFKHHDPSLNDPTTHKKWTNDRALDAKYLVWLLTDPRAISHIIPAKGVQVEYLRIDGYLDLSFAHIPFPVSFIKCAFTNTLQFQHARILTLNLQGSFIYGFHGDDLYVERSLYFRNGFSSSRMIRLNGSHIGRNIECSSSTFNHDISTETDSIDLSSAFIGGTIFMSDGFTSNGRISLINTIVEGNISFNGARINYQRGYAISASMLSVRGGLFFRNSFIAYGQIRLISASVGSSIEFQGAKIINPNRDALVADDIEVKGNIFFTDRFISVGQTRLNGSIIHGNIECDGARFIGSRKYALTFDNSRIYGSVYLRHDFLAIGIISFLHTEIRQSLSLVDLNSIDDLGLNLSSLKVDTLIDDQKYWPLSNHLLLQGFTYNHLVSKQVLSVQDRLRWLNLQPRDLYRPRPYEQLAEYYKNEGKNHDSRKVQIAKNKERLKIGELSFTEKLWYKIFSPIVGYGYRPFLSLPYIIAVILFGTLLFGFSYKEGIIVPTKQFQTQSAENYVVQNISDNYPTFISIMYSIDSFIPLVNLHQVDYWIPIGYTSGVIRITNNIHITIPGIIVIIYFQLHIVLGWFFTTLLVVALTGLVRT